MLQQLNISNFALIDHLQINFEDGFSVITGETGSGKSILLGALGLILGDRADFSSLRSKDKKCIIEGTFKVKKEDHVQYFIDYDLDFDEDTIIRREISASGKSRAFVNDSPISLNALKEFGEKLIDIHSQHETLLIHNQEFIVNLLDNNSGQGKDAQEYISKYLVFNKLKRNLEELKLKEQESLNRKDFLSFLAKEFEEFKLKSLLESDIEEEYKMLSNAEDIKNSLNNAIAAISGDFDRKSIIDNLKLARTELSNISNVSVHIKSLEERLSSVIIEIQDIENECSRTSDNTDIDEQRLTQLEEQISFINRLQHKHQLSSINELLEKEEEIAIELKSIDSLSDDINKLENEITNHHKSLNELAQKLSKNRQLVAKKLEIEAKSMLVAMNMKNAEIKFVFEPLLELSINGCETIHVMAKTNLGGTFEPLKKIASGGETSRIMLAIKSLQTENRSLPTIIFDEIDTGVSGDVANKMGEIMQDLGSKMQVISITHLPQIAAKGSNHYKVYKEEKANQTFSHIVKLSKKERETEIAQLLSGSNITEAALQNALELLKSSGF